MNIILDKLRSFKFANLILFLIFATTIFLQCNFFADSLGLRTDVNVGIKISIAIFISSFIFLFKGKSWIIWVSVFINIWGISNLVYYRANAMLIDAYSVTMIGNMDGFWSSVPFYMNINDYLSFLFTLIVVITYILFKNKSKQIYGFLIATVLSVIVHIVSCKVDNEESDVYNPFSLHHNTFLRWHMWDKVVYAQGTSIIHHLIYETNYFVGKIILKSSYELTDSEKNNINKFLNINSDTPKPKRPIFIVLLESFEGWALTSSSMPNLYEFAHSDNVLYAKKIVSQTRGGTSGDGQMIVNTGLLPTKEGAVCFRYHTNKFPSISELYDKTFNIIPGGNSVWNQGRMNLAYSINSSLEVGLGDILKCNDKTLVDIFKTNYKNYNYGMLLTVSTHTPFEAVSSKSEMMTPDDMPIYLANYLKSFNYTDLSIKTIIDSIRKDEYLKQSVIVFTGDHTVFHKSQRESFNDYCKRNNLPYDVNEGYTSFIMYSPDIEGNIVIEEEAYQMDIYPTILNAIGCENYYWGGFGVNLLEEDVIKERKISAEEALELSDKIHQANYFKELFTSN